MHKTHTCYAVLALVFYLVSLDIDWRDKRETKGEKMAYHIIWQVDKGSAGWEDFYREACPFWIESKEQAHSWAEEKREGRCAVGFTTYPGASQEIIDSLCSLYSVDRSDKGRFKIEE
jgi:hypothetical protein